MGSLYTPNSFYSCVSIVIDTTSSTKLTVFLEFGDSGDFKFAYRLFFEADECKLVAEFFYFSCYLDVETVS